MRRQQQNKTTTAEGKVLSGRAGGLVTGFPAAEEAVCFLNLQRGLLSALIHNAEHTGLSPQPSAQRAEQPVEAALARGGQPQPSSARSIFIEPH